MCSIYIGDSKPDKRQQMSAPPININANFGPQHKDSYFSYKPYNNYY